jgi:RNA polymerase sigma factor (sigma-70 family)
MKNREDAEDVTNDTFLRAFQTPGFPSMSSDHQKNWLFLTAFHRCIETLRRLGKVHTTSGEEPTPDFVDPAPTPHDLAVHDELGRKLAFLTKPEREAVLMWAVGYTYEEIAAALDCSIGKAFTLVKSAITKLKGLYEDDNGQ